MKVFLTGCSGYLGGVLAHHLARVPEVESITAIDVAPPRQPLPPRVVFKQMDIRSPELTALMAGHDVVVHTVFIVHWLARMPASERDDINLNGLRNVARAAVANRVRRFIHASSVAAYDPKQVRGKDQVTEDFPLNRDHPGVVYSHGKAAAERILTETLEPTDTTLTILRSCIIVGPSPAADPERSGAAIIRFRGIDPQVPLIHEDDVAAAFVRAVTTEMPGVYNVAPDDSLRVSALAGMLEGQPIPIVRVWVSRLFLSIAWRFFGHTFHPSWIEMLTSDFTVSNTKLRATGWSPSRSLEDTIRVMAALAPSLTRNAPER